MRSWRLLDRQSYFGLKRRQLQTLYLVAATGLAALIPLIFFSGYWIQSELSKSQKDVGSFLSSRAAALSQRVDAAIERDLSALHALAALPSLDDDVARFETAAKRVAAAMPKWKALSLVDADGTVVFSTATQGSPVDPAMVRRAIAEKHALIETDGAEPDRSRAVILYEPISRESGAAHAFVLVSDAEDIRGILAQATGRDLASVLVDHKGRVLARSAPAGDDPTHLGPDVLRSIAGGGAGLIRTGSDGEPGTTAFDRSTLTGWTSLASIGRSRAEHLFARPVWATIAGGALSILVAGILAVFITHTVMERRVGRERLAASRALGDLDARLLATSREALDDQRKASQEREVLLREIYHRVKNNLQIVQSLLRLGSRELTPDQREPFENAVRRIGAMARVHTLLYNSPDLASIDFKDYLDELLKELSEGFSADDRAIQSALNAEPMRMPLDTAVPLAFIAVEILTNSFKHAFPDGRAGRISVDVHRQGETAVLTIADDGIGLQSETGKRRRLGLTIVRKLVQQIGGEMDEPALGSSVFVIRFPVGSGAPTSASSPVPAPAS